MVMTDTGFALTDRAIEALPYASSGQYFVRDEELRGFAVLVGKRRKTYVVQGDVRAGGRRERSVRIKIGEFGRISTRKARGAAKEILGKIAKGKWRSAAWSAGWCRSNAASGLGALPRRSHEAQGLQR